jgi:hypothetical protein
VVLLGLLFSGITGILLFSLGVGWLFLNAVASEFFREHSATSSNFDHLNFVCFHDDNFNPNSFSLHVGQTPNSQRTREMLGKSQ